MQSDQEAITDDLRRLRNRRLGLIFWMGAQVVVSLTYVLVLVVDFSLPKVIPFCVSVAVCYGIRRRTKRINRSIKIFEHKLKSIK